MLVRVQMQLICPSEADAVTVRDAVVTKLATKPLRVTHSDATVRFRQQWQVLADVSFQLRVDADDVYADVQAEWAGGGLRNRILAGSTATLHVCPHDEAPPWPDCRSIEYQLATKG